MAIQLNTQSLPRPIKRPGHCSYRHENQVNRSEATGRGKDFYMSIISKENRVVTLINVFIVKPENQQPLVDVLVRATKETMRNLPGFISASIHRSYDGANVVNYAQWRSREDFEAMRQNPEARPHMEAAAALGKFDPILCEVVDSIGAGTTNERGE